MSQPLLLAEVNCFRLAPLSAALFISALELSCHGSQGALIFDKKGIAAISAFFSKSMSSRVTVSRENPDEFSHFLMCQ